MPTTLIPAVRSALVDLFDAALAAEDCSAYLGYPVDADPGNKVMVGVDDPMSLSAAPVGEAQLAWRTYGAGQPGGTREERADINCALFVSNGDGDAASADENAFHFLDLCHAAIVAQQDLGVAGCAWALISSVRPYADQDDEGAALLLVFTVSYLGYLTTT